MSSARLAAFFAALAPADDDWRHRAACRGALDPDLWYPVGDGPAVQKQVEWARRICHACPVQADCLQWAIDTREQHGIWGGTTPQERAALLRQEVAQ